MNSTVPGSTVCQQLRSNGIAAPRDLAGGLDRERDPVEASVAPAARSRRRVRRSRSRFMTADVYCRALPAASLPEFWDGLARATWHLGFPRRGRRRAGSATTGPINDQGGAMMTTRTCATAERAARTEPGDPGADHAPGVRASWRPSTSSPPASSASSRPWPTRPPPSTDWRPAPAYPPRRAHQRRRDGGARPARAARATLPQRHGRRRASSPGAARPTCARSCGSGTRSAIPPGRGWPRPSPGARPRRSSSSTTSCRQVASAGIEAILAGPAAALPEVVRLLRHRRLLDVGGGTGSWSIAVAQASPPPRRPPSSSCPPSPRSRASASPQPGLRRASTWSPATP